jgi:hypothetical protein
MLLILRVMQIKAAVSPASRTTRQVSPEQLKPFNPLRENVFVAAHRAVLKFQQTTIDTIQRRKLRAFDERPQPLAAGLQFVSLGNNSLTPSWRPDLNHLLIAHTLLLCITKTMQRTRDAVCRNCKSAVAGR